MKSDFKIILRKPENGWLPVTIQYKEITEEFYASDVPVDPLGLLVNSLFTALNGRSQEVWWHLEPAGYFMNIGKLKNEYEVTLEYSKDSNVQNKEKVFCATGSGKEIILPIWRALREFYSHDYSEPAWPGCSSEEMDELKVLIDKLKLENG